MVQTQAGTGSGRTAFARNFTASTPHGSSPAYRREEKGKHVDNELPEQSMRSLGGPCCMPMRAHGRGGSLWVAQSMLQWPQPGDSETMAQGSGAFPHEGHRSA